MRIKPNRRRSRRVILGAAVADGLNFPPQHKFATRCCGWRVGEVDIWLRNPMSFTLADLERARDAA
jgi:prophage regulatory protein